MKINQIYVNLPVKNIQKTKEFWTNLGFSVNEQISDDRAVCIIMNDTISIMFLTEEFFETFSERPVPKGDTTQVLVAIGLESREEVDQVVNAAVANGATQHEEAQDHGWMYQHAFVDLDGHQWEIAYMDASQLPEQES